MIKSSDGHNVQQIMAEQNKRGRERIQQINTEVHKKHANQLQEKQLELKIAYQELLKLGLSEKSARYISQYSGD